MKDVGSMSTCKLSFLLFLIVFFIALATQIAQYSYLAIGVPLADHLANTVISLLHSVSVLVLDYRYMCT